MKARWPLAGLLALALAACGGAPKPAAPIEARGGEPAAAMTEPEVVLRALAKAASDDDGAALDALVHPTHGLWLWDHPGATVAPSVHVKPADVTPPTKRLVSSGMNDHWKAHYWSAVATGLGAIERMDREPADRFAPIYGDCGEEVPAAELRAWLVMKDDFDDHYALILEDANLDLDRAMTGELVHYRSWGLDVWIAQDRGRLWVVHIMVWTPCDA